MLSLLDERSFHRTRPSRLWWGAATIVALAIGVYAWAAWSGNLFWQDGVTLNRVTSLYSLAHFWFHPAGAYRPLSLSLLWLERRGFGRSPLPYHCVSVVLHAISCVLVWLILRRLNVRGAWLAAALFAVLPLQVQSVVWITQQPYLIGALLYVLTVWCYLRWARVRPPLPQELAELEPSDPPGRAGYVWVLVLAFLTMLTGPAALSLPVVLLLIVGWQRGSLPRAEWARLAPFFIIAILVGAAGLILHHQTLDPLDLAAPSPSLLQRVAIAGRAIAVAAIDVVRLYPTAVIRPRWDAGWDVWNILPIALIAAVAIVAWAGRRRWGAAPAVCIGVFVALLLPGIIAVLCEAAPAVYVADPQAYLAAAVPMALIGMGLIALASWLGQHASLRAARAGVSVVALGAVATFAAICTLAYRDADTGFKVTLKHDPSNVAARAQYALYLEDQNPTRALQVIDDAGAGADPMLLSARGHVLTALGRHDEAIAAYLLAQRLLPDHAGVRLGLAEAYDAAGRQAMADARHDDAFENYQGALAAYDAARSLVPAGNEAIDDGVGRVLLDEGRVAESVERFDAALALNDGYVPAHVHKAQALFDQAVQNNDAKQGAESSDQLAEALSIEPGNLQALMAGAEMRLRAASLVKEPQAQHGPYAVAESYYRQAIQSDPESSRAWMGLGTAQLGLGHSQEAARSFGRAAALDPDSPQAWTQLGLAQLAQDQTKDAVQSFGRALALRPDAADAQRGLAQAQSASAAGNKKS